MEPDLATIFPQASLKPSGEIKWSAPQTLLKFISIQMEASLTRVGGLNGVSIKKSDFNCVSFSN